MTDINKALVFARECLKWQNACHKNGIVSDPETHAFFDPDSLPDCQTRLDEFLGKRYYAQMNRGTTTLFKWSVIVGLQDLTAMDAHHHQACADSDDLFDAIFDACVMAARMDK